MKKERLDHILLKNELVESRSKAKALIMAGKVLVNDVVIDKAGTLILPDAQIRIKEQLKFVSRGGLKLEKALKEFGLDVSNFTCLDIGASTGGFTDVLLQNHAKKVFAIDVGYGQLHNKLQQDDRVIMMDKTNFRHFDISQISDFINLVVMDVSFISIKKIIPKIIEFFSRDSGEHYLISLVKPQFEVGKEYVGKGGIVRDDAARNNVLKDIEKYLSENQFLDIQTTVSPITGATGNIEFLIYARFAK